MIFHGITLEQGSKVSNLTIASGTSFPTSPDEGELFFRSDADTTLRGLYCYIGGTWDRIASTDSLTVPNGATTPASGNEGDIFYLNSNDANEGLYVYKNGSWSQTGGGGSSSFTISGDITGTIDGGTDELTLSTTGVTAGSYGAGDKTLTLTVDSKGRLSAVSAVTATPAFADVTGKPTTLSGYGITDAQALDADLTAIAGLSGTSGLLRKTAANTWSLDTTSFLTGNESISVSGDATGSGTRSIELTLASTGVTAGSYGSASQVGTFTVDAKGRLTGASAQDIAIGAGAVTSGTFADARIAASNVTQHQAALTITETQITDGSLLARVGGNETITGAWAFSNPVTVATPTAAGHAVTKSYVDDVAQGLQTKPAVEVATTTNLTATYSNGTAGVGATLTASSNGAFPAIDGVTLSSTTQGQNGVLVKNQTNPAHNGRYNLTTVGDANTPWVLTRCGLCDQASEIPGAYVFVKRGTLNAATGWVQTVANPTTFVVGTDSISVTQFSGAGAYTAGAGLAQSGTTFSVGTASASRIVINADDIDLATVSDAGGGSFLKFSRDSYGRVTGTSAVAASDITSLVNDTYVNVAGDAMTGQLAIATSADIQLTATGNGTGGGNIGVYSTDRGVVLGVRPSSDALGALAYVYTANNQPMAFSTNALERMRILADGKVGIGIEAPDVQFAVSSGFPSSVDRFGAGTVGNVSSLYLGASLATSGSFRLSYERTSGDTIFYNGTNDTPVERMRIASGGNVGIGTVSPAGRLHVTSTSADATPLTLTRGVDVTTVGPAGVRLEIGALNGTTPVSGAQIGTVIFNPTTTADLYFSTREANALTERMRILSNGNVGIGTGSPQAKLEVDHGAMRSRFENFHLALSGEDNVGGVSRSIRFSPSTTTTNANAFNVGFYGASNAADYGYLAFPTADATGHDSTKILAMRRDTGNVGIGTASPAGRLHVSSGSSDATPLTVASAATSTNLSLVNAETTVLVGTRPAAHPSGALAYIYTANNMPMAFSTNNAERVRITAAGNLLLGTTSDLSQFYRLLVTANSETAAIPLGINDTRTGSAASASVEFRRGGALAGTITTTNNATAYNTSSDVRLKDNIVDAPSAIAKVKAMQIRSFDWKADGSHVDHGFIAQELNEVEPLAVTQGETWAIDPSKLVATLTKALQEALTRIETLEAEVQALKK